MDPSEMDAPAPRRPMARTHRVSLFRREIVERVSVAGFEALLAEARQISEGQLEQDGRYYGSTMITMEVADLAPRVREACDARTAQKVAQQLEQDPALLKRLARVGLDQARGIAGQGLRRPVTEVRVTGQGSQVLVDVDVEASAMARRGEVNGS